MCIDHPHVGPTTTFWFKNRRKFFSKKKRIFFLILRDCAQISFGGTYSHISSVRSSVRVGPMRLYVFFLDITKHSHAFLAL